MASASNPGKIKNFKILLSLPLKLPSAASGSRRKEIFKISFQTHG